MSFHAEIVYSLPRVMMRNTQGGSLCTNAASRYGLGPDNEDRKRTWNQLMSPSIPLGFWPTPASPPVSLLIR